MHGLPPKRRSCRLTLSLLYFIFFLLAFIRINVGLPLFYFGGKGIFHCQSSFPWKSPLFFPFCKRKEPCGDVVSEDAAELKIVWLRMKNSFG